MDSDIPAMFGEGQGDNPPDPTAAPVTIAIFCRFSVMPDIRFPSDKDYEIVRES